MSTEVLTLAQLLSPSFPVGAFAYSHGLETAIDQGLVTDGASLQNWLSDVLQFGSGQADATLLNAAFAAPETQIAEIDAHARAFAASKERLMESDLQGLAFCDTVLGVWAIDLGRLTYPVAVGRAAQAMALDVELTTAMYLQAMVGNLCAAAIRLVPLGQTDGQLVQAALKPLCQSIAADAKGAALDDLHSCAFMSDIMAMQHETQSTRIFRT